MSKKRASLDDAMGMLQKHDPQQALAVMGGSRFVAAPAGPPAGEPAPAPPVPVVPVQGAPAPAAPAPRPAEVPQAGKKKRPRITRHQIGTVIQEDRTDIAQTSVYLSLEETYLLDLEKMRRRRLRLSGHEVQTSYSQIIGELIRTHLGHLRDER